MQMIKFCASTPSGAFNLLCENFKSRGKSGVKSIFVVPDGCSEIVKNKMIYSLVDGASFDIDILTLSELLNCAKFDKEMETIRATDGGFIVKKFLVKHENELRCFGLTKKTLTFASMIYDVIFDFKKNGVEIPNLKNDIASITDERQKNKFFDLCFIYEKYEQFLKQNNLIDEVDKFRLAVDCLKQSANFGNTNFYFCFFDKFFQYQLGLIEILAGQCNQIGFCVAVPNDGQVNAEIYLSKLDVQIDYIAKKLNTKCEKISNFINKSVTKAQICENLFALSSSIKSVDANNKIVLMSSDCISNEVLYVAKRISWLVKNGLCKFGDIIICAADLNLYQPFIKKHFEKLNLSYWISGGVPLEEMQCFKFVVDALFCVCNNFMSSDMLKIVYNPTFGFDKEKIEFVETMVSKYGVDASMWFTPLKNEKGGENFKKFEQQKQEIVAPFLSFKTELANAKTLADYVNAVFNLLNNVNARENLQSCKTKLQDCSNDTNVVLRQSFDKFVKTFEDVLKNVGDTEIDFADFLAFLQNVVGKKSVPKSAKTIDSILIGNVNDTKWTDCKYLFVLGANEGVFPSSKGDVGIVADGEKRVVKCLKDMPTVAEKNIESKFAVLQVLLAGEELTVCYPEKGLSEKIIRSGVVDALQNLFTHNGYPLPVVKIKDLIDDDNAFGSIEEKICFNIASVGNAFDYVAEADLPDAAFKILVDLFKENGIDISNCLTNDEIACYVKNAKELFFPKGSTMVTQLEKYFECPFSHFLTKGLKLFEKEQSQIKPSEIGSVLHGVVEDFVKNYGKKTMKKEEILQISAKIFAKIIAKPEFEHLMLDKKNETILNGLKKESGNICLAICYQNSHSKFETKFCEASFGDENFAKMAEFDVGGTKILLHGKVDRVDMFENYVRVVDYKTGKISSEYKTNDLYYGKKIQLFVYMWAILKGMKQKDLQPAGVFLMPLHNELSNDEKQMGFAKYKMNGTTLNEEKILRAQDDQVGGSNTQSDIIKFTIKKSNNKDDPFVLSGRGNEGLVSVEKFNKMLDYSMNISSNAIAEILSGYIQAKPHESACKYCGAKGLCDFYKNVTRNTRKFNFEIGENSFDGEEKDRPAEKCD